jgi:hypothetical protein
MMSFGKFQAAITQFNQETTIAKLADLNFNFTLVKLEAPPEFKALGAALSNKRRSDAESGSTHVTARKLGALFYSILPDTPNLIRAYGNRVSEISQSPSVNPKASKSHGAFKEYVGVDGTTIWAAATSGRGAVAVHLLACMLASIWSPSEAVSIWRELVDERKKDLIKKINSDAFLVDDLGMAHPQQTVSKEELQDWDASARAWLRAADGAQIIEKHKKKLINLVGKVHLPIGHRSQVYSGVTEAWKSALETVDKIVMGFPYSVARDGAVLAALSAWHLYPDMVVLSTSNEAIIQNDDLIASGGVVTIGLTGNESEQGNGVFWSLSLAHLRFYGPPVVASRSVNSDSGRLTTMELGQVILGATIACWGLERRQIDEAMELIVLIDETLRTEIEAHPQSTVKTSLLNTSWITFLAQAVATYRSSANDQLKLCQKSVYHGYRHPGFLSTQRCSSFGLSGPEIVSLMENFYEKVAFLRSLALRILPPLPADALIIRHRDIRRLSRDHGKGDYDEYYSVLKPSVQGNNEHISLHFCLMPRRNYRESATTLYPMDVLGYETDDIQESISGSSFTWKNAPSRVSVGQNGAGQLEIEKGPPSPETKHRMWGLQKRKKETKQQDLATKVVEFQFVAGELSDVALFEQVYDPMNAGKSVTYNLFPALSITEISDYIKGGAFSAAALMRHLSTLEMEDGQRDLLASLRALGGCMKIYENLPGATVSPNLITNGKQIGRSRWAIASQDPEGLVDRLDEWVEGVAMLLPYSLSRQAAFAAVCMLDTGTLDMDPTYLNEVMAVSSGDSLYIAAPLLCDPATYLLPSDIRRVIGNIGRAGLALLIPPKNPEIRRPDPNMWKVINHEKFEGKLEDCFPNTSLHLSFTGYELPVAVGEHGGQVVEAFYIESRISVHDSGKWVADIDPLGAFLNPRCSALVQQPHCESKPVGHKPDFEVTSIENWEELLDPPKSAAVVKAHGNWQARLATTAVCIGLGHHAIIFQGHGCWGCGEKTLRLLEKKRQIHESERLTTVSKPSAPYPSSSAGGSGLLESGTFIFIL